MEKDKLLFSLISTSSIYVYLREKHSDYNIQEADGEANIKHISQKILEIEKYAHMPDAKNIINQEYQKIKGYMLNNEFRESKLLNYIQKKSADLSSSEKEDILNYVMHIVMDDNKISSEEIVVLKQLSAYLGLEKDINKLSKEYKKADKNSNSFPIKTFIIGLLLLAGLAGGIYWKYIQIEAKKNFFEKSKLVFSQVYFNRYVVYQNSSNIQNEHFYKLAVYFMSGNVDIAVDTSNLKYNSFSKTLKVKYKKPYIFETTVNLNNAVEVDKQDPKPISAEEAKKVATLVGFASAIAGAKIGSNVASISFLPKKLSFLNKYTKLIGGAVGGTVAGGAGYYFANSALKGLSLSKDITKQEKAEVVYTAKELIKFQINTDPQLKKAYKINFEKFIKAEYLKHNMEINNIEYVGSLK